jgi:Mlc titration factor MtfA (ptsG expression regulator)
VPYILLKQKNSYFKNLSAEAQERFIERMYKFMEDKYFVGREGLVITDEIRVLISASAVQLTFGLKDYTISHLHTINVFPKAFYSKLFDTSFKGLTTQGGVLSLSWDDFKDGYSDDQDKLNLGLHELAHALNIDLDEDGTYDDHFSYYFEKWRSAAMNDFKRLKEGSITFLRKYGSRNLHEFFAVCIEHFFEAPSQFKRELPVLYGHTALMLNQDPENAEEDYKVKSIAEYFGHGEYAESSAAETPIQAVMATIPDADPERQEQGLQPHTPLTRFISRNGIYVAMGTTFAGLFIGIPLLIWFVNVMIVNIGTLMMLIFLCGALGLVQWKYVKNHIDMEYHHFAMYAFSGFAMCFLNFLLFINLNVPITDRTETYTVDRFHIRINHGAIDVLLDDAALARNLSTFLNEHFDDIPESKSMTVKYATGLLGFDSIEECTFN